MAAADLSLYACEQVYHAIMILKIWQHVWHVCWSILIQILLHDFAQISGSNFAILRGVRLRQYSVLHKFQWLFCFLFWPNFGCVIHKFNQNSGQGKLPQKVRFLIQAGFVFLAIWLQNNFPYDSDRGQIILSPFVAILEPL